MQREAFLQSCPEASPRRENGAVLEPARKVLRGQPGELPRSPSPCQRAGPVALPLYVDLSFPPLGWMLALAPFRTQLSLSLSPPLSSMDAEG